MKSKTWLALLAVYLIWGSTYLAISFVVKTIPPFLSAGIRFVISGLILFVWRRLAGETMPTARQWRSAGIVGLLLLLGGNGLVSWAEQMVPSGVTALIIGSIPIWLVLIEAMRPSGVKPNRRAILGLISGFIGIIILIGPLELGGGEAINPLGAAALLLAALFWAIGSIYSRSADMPGSALMSTAAEMLIGSMGLLLVSGLTGEWAHFDPAAVSQQSWLGLLYLILFGSLIGFTCYGWLLRNAPVSLVATYAYVNPVVAVFLGSWLANEALNGRILLAALIIIGSVVLVTSAPRSKTSPDAAAAEIAD
jgi:drug/metabolite transporter (DMT)-like permease